MCPALWDPMDCSTPCFPVLHSFPEIAQSPHVHWSGDAIQPSHPPLLPGNLRSQLFSLHGLPLWLRRSSLVIKCLPVLRETRVQSLGWKDPLEKEMATHSSTLAWKIPWTEEPGRLQSMESQRIGHDWATSLSLALHTQITRALKSI